MKNKFFVLPIVLFAAGMAASCGTILPPRYDARAWAAGNGEKAAVRLVSVTVDKIGGASSIQKEAETLAALYLRKNGYRAAADGSAADYTAEIVLREREYASGWRTVHSLSAEARFYSGSALAAGRVSTSGDISLSSSAVLERMISKAIGRGTKALKKSVVSE